ncbi:MAG: LacI family DNA-binding transcriptional regulator [Chloroflexota bacterium]
MKLGESRRITVRDVARRAGLSVAAASYALNGHNEVSEATRKRVEQAAAELNYHPSHAARGLRGLRANTVGLILPFRHSYVDDAPFLDVLGGIDEAIAPEGFDVLLAHSGSATEEMALCHRLMFSGKVDGMILARSRLDDRRVAELRERRFPFALNGRGEAPDVCAAEVDNVAGARLVAEHLIGLGHRRIGFIGGPPDYTSTVDRCLGFRQALDQAGIALDSALMAHGELTADAGQAAFEALFSQGLRPTAMFVAADAMALGAMRAARAMGIQPGRDVAIAGFGDVAAAAFADPPLTTINQRPHAVGLLLGRMLLDQLAGRHIEQPYQALEPRLVIRSSSTHAISDTAISDEAISDKKGETV